MHFPVDLDLDSTRRSTCRYLQVNSVHVHVVNVQPDGPNMRLPFGVLVCASALCIGSALSASAPSFPDCSPKADAHVPYNGTLGPFAPVATQTIIFQGHPIVLIAPQAVGPFPLMVFMHGSTGQIGMYQKNLANYASHGFLVAFPYIKVRCSLSSTA